MAMNVMNVADPVDKAEVGQSSVRRSVIIHSRRHALIRQNNGMM